ncbi:MAG: winged helix-turn-helix domain-containing protein, partial [Nitrososphaerales archaeon]
MRGLGERQHKERAETQRLIMLALSRGELTFGELFEATKALKKKYFPEREGTLSRSTFYTQLKNLINEGVIVKEKGWWEPNKPIYPNPVFYVNYDPQSHKIIRAWSPIIKEKFKEIREGREKFIFTRIRKLTKKQAREAFCSYARWNPKRKVYR